jgi:hypothetical protein
VYFGQDFPKFALTSATNVSLSILKDRAFAKMFKVNNTQPVRFPPASLGLFGVRDSLTILASFTLPPKITPIFQHLTGLSASTSSTICQLATPLSIQLLSVPMHLYALDLYNKPVSSNQLRLEFIKREYTKTVLARWARILPAFGIGGVLNTKLLNVLK